MEALEKIQEAKRVKVGLTSVTFRDKSVEEIISLAQKCRLDGIEWGGDVHVPLGDLARAKEVKEKTLAAGLEVFSYGGYYTVGEGQVFDETLKTTLALGADTVRVWAPKISSVYAKKEVFDCAVVELRRIGLLCEKEGITLCLEFHNGTLNDFGRTSAALLNAVGLDNVRTYWQPLYSLEQNLRDITLAKEKIENVHVYHWTYGDPIVRHLLSEAEENWKEYYALLGNRKYILEFSKDGAVENFEKDVTCLKKVLGVRND